MEPQRPSFSEGQILAAADLTVGSEHTRGQLARHQRYLHDWGIAEGLALNKADKRDKDGNPYVEVTVAPGLAVDGTGREIVVTETLRVSEALFDQINGANPDPDAFYPVLLHGVDRPGRPPALSATACGPNGQPNRIIEAYEVTFGRLGAERQLTEQQVPEVGQGPVPAEGQPPWDILLGFVRWDNSIQRFVDATPSAGGIGRRYAGVKADSVAARGGSLQLRANPTVQAGDPALVLGGDPLALTFGLLKGDGSVDERFSVDADGNVKATGTVSGSLKPGEVRIQSGVVTDGVILPLPAGITEDAVRDGNVTLHVQLTPHIPPSATPLNCDVYRPLECSVDGDRRVQCRVRWFDLAAPATTSEQPAAADYVVVAVSTNGAGP